MVIYIGNLPIDFYEQQLREKFESFGKVASAKVLVDKISGRGLGFGFVEMPGRNQARDAINALNRTRFGSRLVIVSETADRKERREANKEQLIQAD